MIKSGALSAKKYITTITDKTMSTTPNIVIGYSVSTNARKNKKVNPNYFVTIWSILIIHSLH